MTPRRAAAATAAAAVLAVGVPAAWAEGFVTVQGDPVVAHGPVPLRGDVDATERDSIELRLTAPGTSPQAVATLPPAEATERARTVGFALQTDDCSVPEACAVGGTAPNGAWTVQLVAVPAPDLQAEERVLATGRLVLDVPASAPRDVTATVTAPRRVRVSWARGTEPDVLRWTVTDGAGHERTVTPEDRVCANGTCATTFDYPEDATGDRSFSVTATRACGTPDCTPGRSPATTSAAVAVTAPPGTATPSAGPQAPGETPSPAASPAPGGTGRADTTALGQGFRDLAPQVGAPRLPSLQGPEVAAPQLPDTFEDTLGYTDRVETVPQEPVVAGGRESILTATGGLVDDEQLVRSVAGALVLLLAGAHLRTWLARGRDDTA